MNFDSVKTYPIAERKNKFHIRDMIPLDNSVNFHNHGLEELAVQIKHAKNTGSPIVMMMGGAVIKEGCSLLIIDLMRHGYVTHLAMNGSVSIHDFEIAMIGQTSEDVQDGLDNGTFGMAEETGALMNEAINAGYKQNLGYGQSIAQQIADKSFTYKESSIFYHTLTSGNSPTVHVAIGGDIIHQHRDCNGAALGATSFADFQSLTKTMMGINEGVVLNVGSAVIMPEVFLKALTIARNLGHKHNNFTVSNFDFLEMYRPKTRVLEWPRSLGAKAINVLGRHNVTIPALHALLCR